MKLWPAIVMPVVKLVCCCMFDGNVLLVVVPRLLLLLLFVGLLPKLVFVNPLGNGEMLVEALAPKSKVDRPENDEKNDEFD